MDGQPTIPVEAADGSTADLTPALARRLLFDEAYKDRVRRTLLELERMLTDGQEPTETTK